MRTLDELVLDAPMFAGLEPHDAELIAGCAENVKFSVGDVLFREGDEAARFYVVRHGRVALQTFVPHRGALTIDTVEEGEPIGWSWLVPPFKWHFTGVACELVRAVSFDASCLRGKCEEDPRLGYELMKRFAPIMLDRLQATRLRLLDVYGDGARN